VLALRRRPGLWPRHRPRSTLKIGGGYLLARGLADNSTVEALIAGALALTAVLWGVWHRNPPKPRQVEFTHLPILLVAALPLGGCATPNTIAFRTEKLATDTAYAGLLAWKAYYSAALSNTTPENLGTLSNRNAQVYTASRQFAASLSIADSLRETCATNAAASNQTALQITLTTAQAHSSNLLWLVRSFTTNPAQ